MKRFDLLAMAWHNLRQRLLRTVLNLVGIVIGCIIVLLTTAGATGIKAAVGVLFDSSEFAREIRVSPGYLGTVIPPKGAVRVEGKMSKERRKRIYKALRSDWVRENSKPEDYRISPETLDQIRQIPNVERVFVSSSVDAVLKSIHDSSSETKGAEIVTDQVGKTIGLASIDVHAQSLPKRLIAGEIIRDENRKTDVMVSEIFAYKLGFRSDKDLPKIIGKVITAVKTVDGNGVSTLQWMINRNLPDQPEGITLQQQQASLVQAIEHLSETLDETALTEQEKQTLRMFSGAVLPKKKKSDPIVVEKTFRVCGVLREDGNDLPISKLFKQWFSQTSEDLMLHPETAFELRKQVKFSEHVFQVKLVVDSTRNLQKVTKAIKVHSLDTNSALWVWDNIDSQIGTATKVVYGIAFAILVTTGIGISNTLVISVLQRTPEFGILKSLGMRDRDLMLLMLFEGGLLGLIGASLALAISIAVAWLGRTLLAAYVGSRMGETMDGIQFQFSLLPILLMYLIAIGICVFASLLPAWRAAKLDPIVAMRRD